MVSAFDYRRVSRYALVLAALTAAACDNPVEGDHEEHAVGFIIQTAAGQEAARFNGATLTGQLTVARGSSATYTVVGLGEDGDQITIDGTEYSITAVATGGFGTAAVQNGNRLVLTGTLAGTGAVEVTLNHEGHAEFSRAVPFLVSP